MWYLTGFMQIRTALRRTFPAFQSRNYRLFFVGQGLSLTGMWMTRIASIWLVYQLTQSSVLLGLTGFMNLIPTLVLVPFSGVLIDRWNRYRILLVVQVLAMSVSLTLAGLALTGMLQIWQILGLSLMHGSIKALESPTRQAFVPTLIQHKDNLGSAIALNSSLFNGARLIGPAIAGLIITHGSIGYCFLLDGLSYIAILVALSAMQFPPKAQRHADRVKPPFWQTFGEGFRYVLHSAPIRSILMLLAIVSFMGLQYSVILPVYAKEVLQGGADTLGVLMAALGIGALVAGLSLGMRQQPTRLELLVAIAPVATGSGLIALSLCQSLWLAVLLIGLVGFSFLLQSAASNTLVQMMVTDDKRGRVMSLYIMSFIGMVPLGNLFVGALVNWIGLSGTLVITGSSCIVGSLLFVPQLPKFQTSDLKNTSEATNSSPLRR
jgi:MFS family permease